MGECGVECEIDGCSIIDASKAGIFNEYTGSCSGLIDAAVGAIENYQLPGIC